MIQQCAVFQFAWSLPWSLYPSPPPPSKRQKMHSVDQIFWTCLLNLLGTVHLNTARELPAKTCLTPHTIVFQKWKTKTKSGSLRQTAAGKSFFYIFVWRNLQPSYRFPLSSSFRREQSLSMSIYWCINTDPSFSIRTHTQDTTPTHTSYSYYNRCYPTLKTSATIVCIKETTVFQQARLLGRVGHNMVKLLWIACDTVAAIFQLTSGELTQVSDETMYLGSA